MRSTNQTSRAETVTAVCLTNKTRTMMKNKYLSLVALAAAAIATSCSGDQLATDAEQQPTEPQTVTLTASIAGDNTTRVGMSRNGGTVSFYWHEGDQITVQFQKKTDNTQYSYNHFTIADGTETGATTATFKGTVDTGYDVGDYALYPAHGGHQMGSSDFAFYLQNSYSQTTVEGNIFSKTTDGVTTYPTISTKMSMLGTIDNDNKSITFKHLGGLLVIRIDKMPSASGEIVLSTDQNLWGCFLIQDPESSTPYIASSMLASSSSPGNFRHSVTFNYYNATVGSAGVFYLPVPTGEYTSLKISVNGATAEYGDLNVNRADVITIPVYQGTTGSYSCDYVVNGHKFIDLCLPSGTLWAETNVGAETAADVGCHFAWGETDMTTKASYSWSTYKYGTGINDLKKYSTSDGRTILDNEDDAAYMNWGSFCRMPIPAEFTELLNYCSWEWTTMSNSANISVNGCKVTSNKNGNSIFLPASGDRNESAYSDYGVYGNYWSRVLVSSNYGHSYYFRFSETTHNLSDYGFYYSGHSVRPVTKKYGYELDNSSVGEMDMNDFDDGWK